MQHAYVCYHDNLVCTKENGITVMASSVMVVNGRHNDPIGFPNKV